MTMQSKELLQFAIILDTKVSHFRTISSELLHPYFCVPIIALHYNISGLECGEKRQCGGSIALHFSD